MKNKLWKRMFSDSLSDIAHMDKSQSLRKAEDPAAYAKLASTGFILAYPVKINGKDKRPDNGIDYHATIKFFDKKNDKPEDAHKTASALEMNPPDPKQTKIEPKMLTDRNGNDVYAISLQGAYADKMKEHHEKFDHLGHKENYEWNAHVSVDKATHDKIKASGAKTAEDAGIEFSNAELRKGPKTLETYSPNIEKPSKLDLKKGSKDITEKTLAEIQEDTAWTWASRAAACYEKLKETGDWKWKTDAEEYRHEAVEHAALIGDTHPTVLQEIHDALEEYRKEAQKEAEEINKSEKITLLNGDDLRRYIEDNPELKRGK